MKIYNVGNRKINLYLIDSGTHRLLVDSGFPNETHELGRQMRQTGFKISEIDYLLITHFHVDHAGAVQELKNQGVTFVLFDLQKAFIRPMEEMVENKWPYTELNLADNKILLLEESEPFLNNININGKVMATPGHSDDSVSLVLDSGEVFTGDLTPPFSVDGGDGTSKSILGKDKKFRWQTGFSRTRATI